MAPKSLLRHPAATSQISDLTDGSFEEILDDPRFGEGSPAPARVILCSGKVYYDLVDHRDRSGIADAAIVRVEQLYRCGRTAWP